MTLGAVEPTSSWTVVSRRGSAAELHTLEIPNGPEASRAVWPMTLERGAVVLGSTQAAAVVDGAAAAAAGLDVAQRRSGGGAVLLRPADSVWIDVIVPRGDALWSDDVGRSFDWLGAAWVRTLVAVGAAGESELAVFPGPMRRTPSSDLVCFAGLGPGEVTWRERKVVGLSQRRTRAGARFQCLLYVGPEGEGAAIVPLLARPAERTARAALTAQLRAGVAAVPVRAATLLRAFLASLPD